MTCNKWIILDIDGVMIAYPEGPTYQPDYLTASCVDALKHIIVNIPGVKFCLSSSMRLSVSLVAKLQRMLLSAGLPADLFSACTPIAGVLTSNCRKEEITEFITKHTTESDFITIIDDEVIHDRPYLKIDARIGLTMKDAEFIVRVFGEGKEEVLANYSIFGFGPSLILSIDSEL